MAENNRILVRITGKVESTYDRKSDSVKQLKVYTFKQKKSHTVLVPYSIFCPVAEGDAISAVCVVESHPRYGEQLRVEEPPFIELGVDRDTVVQCFIKSLRGTGMGNVKSQKLYERFLKYTANKNEKEVVSYITELSFRYMRDSDNSFFGLYDDLITDGQIAKLMKWWYKQRSLRRLYLLGLNNREIKSIRRLSLNQIYDQCIKNPFVIAEIPLEKCVSILKRISRTIGPDDIRRGQMVRKIHDYTSNKGWTGVPISKLAYIFPDMPLHLDVLYKEYGIRYDLETVYLEYPYIVETEMAKKLTIMARSTFDSVPSEDANFMRKTLTEEQKRAVQMALDNKISIVTGGPGTGKTTIVSEIIHNLELRDISYEVASFTGKAVARLREVIGKRTPSTMHKMIAKSKDYKKSNGQRGFRHLIIDEVSMVTLELMYEFMEVFDHDYSITLVGDKDQLEGIGWGNLFGELIMSQTVPTVYLTKNHRVVQGFAVNGILLNAKAMTDYDPEVDLENFQFTVTENFQLLDGNINFIYDIVRSLKNCGIPSTNVTIISPYNKYLDEINSTCQQVFNDGNEYVCDSRNKVWMVADRVMMAENNYDINIMNGEEGIVKSVSLDKGSIDVEFYDHGTFEFKLESKIKENDNTEWQGFYSGEKFVENDELTVMQLRHSFAITVHKFQGSECDYIIFFVPEHNGNNFFLTKNLVYTAITRAKIAVWGVGDIDALSKGAVNPPQYRCDNLCRRIVKHIQDGTEFDTDEILSLEAQSTDVLEPVTTVVDVAQQLTVP